MEIKNCEIEGVACVNKKDIRPWCRVKEIAEKYEQCVRDNSPKESEPTAIAIEACATLCDEKFLIWTINCEYYQDQEVLSI